MEINGYQSDYRTNSTGNVKDLNIQKENERLNMQDFLNLLVAQITNQDAMNPMENTEFISQMAQFSSLQAMSDLSEIAAQGQATSLIGKNVVVADYNSKGGLEIQEGIVQKVTLFSGKAQIYVNDVEYDYSNIMEIKEIKEVKEPEEPKEPKEKEPKESEEL
ncbi:MAG: flagellar hook capping FlgD N-terminal domain-containing protein [Tissierellia bacterium]|nr:flagellar hook capping FlgD N-terminal domain-containing protein [Tissierellia bacterium]